jgi:hypothetical protein
VESQNSRNKAPGKSQTAWSGLEEDRATKGLHNPALRGENGGMLASGKRRASWKTCVSAVSLAVAAFALLSWRSGWWGLDRVSLPAGSRTTAGSDEVSAWPAGPSSTTVEIDGFCGACHATPHPDGAPREAWPSEIRKGYKRYERTGRKDLVVPRYVEVIDYYQRHAPPQAEVLPPPCTPLDEKLRFRCTAVATPVGTSWPFTAGLTFLEPTVAHDSPNPQFLFCDMHSGQVAATRLTSAPAEICERLASPCHLKICDLDQDGQRDVLVAELGDRVPSDHDLGKVVWLRGEAAGGYQRIDLAAGLGRVADVQAADFDEDGDLDLVVAEFGWMDTGRILLLENQKIADGSADFALHVLDSRHGSIHVPVADLNHDGHLDFVALISQEHEVIEAFLGRGDNHFDRRTIFSAGDPAYSSSGIQLLDLDGDGDLDVLYTNGDCLDVMHLKPYQAVQWLENQGAFPFEPHLLGRMPGVSRALAGDLDGDGDLDVAAVALLPPEILGAHDAENFDSLIWFEQSGTRQFTRHTLEKSLCRHACLEVGDFDADGDVDLVVGHAVFDPPSRGPELPAITVWWNQRVEVH